MKDIRIDGRMQRVFVLKETADRVVYIPVKVLHRVDYQRLIDIEAAAAGRMLDRMSETTLDNGINALVMYDKLIQVMEVSSNARLRKPDEPLEKTAPVAQVFLNNQQLPAAPAPQAYAPVAPAAVAAPVAEAVKPRGKPGPKPKPKPAP